MALRFPRGHAATKKLIASCAADGVGIDGLADAPRFRFIPAESKAPVSSFSNGSDHGEPSKRGSIACGKAKPKHIKNWNPSRLSADSMYGCPMAGDGWVLDSARKQYAKGNPKPLREYLAKLAAARLAAGAPVQLRLAA